MHSGSYPPNEITNRNPSICPSDLSQQQSKDDEFLVRLLCHHYFRIFPNDISFCDKWQDSVYEYFLIIWKYKWLTLKFWDVSRYSVKNR